MSYGMIHVLQFRGMMIVLAWATVGLAGEAANEEYVWPGFLQGKRSREERTGKGEDENTSLSG